jgi:hypothetical protein
MSSSVEEHVIYAIANAPMREYPYAHIYVEQIFPPDFYARLRASWPRASDLVSLESTGRVPKGAYPERFIMPLRQDKVAQLLPDAQAFWTETAEWLLGARVLGALVEKFDAHVQKRFEGARAEVGFASEVLVVRDHTNFSIGPHTDAPHRLLSLLFYCPDDESMKHLGTSIYTPIDPSFRCTGGPHYPHDRFTKVATMEYRPNTLFAFFKTDHSFHGVDKVRDADVLRDLVLYDIRVMTTAAKAHPVEPAASGSLGLRLLRRALGRGR